jgi:hypothetical protein
LSKKESEQEKALKRHAPSVNIFIVVFIVFRFRSE